MYSDSKCDMLLICIYLVLHGTGIYQAFFFLSDRLMVHAQPRKFALLLYS